MDDRIVLTRPLPGDPKGRFAAAGFTNVWINPRDERIARADLLKAIAGARAVVATPADVQINAEFFEAAGPQLVIVSNYAVGVDNIDLEEARRRGIIVGNTPDAVTEPTADCAWLLMLAAGRRAREGLAIATSGAWKGIKPLDPPGRRMVGKTLLIVGPGRIGRAVARRAPGFDMNVLYIGRSRQPEMEAAPIHGRRVPLDEGLALADYVTIHTPLTEQTHHLIGAPQLARMKPTAVLVNTSRGPVVDEAALAEALHEGRLFAAGLDVFEHEPKIHPDLIGHERAFLLPHWGSTTDEDRVWMMDQAIDNVIAALQRKPVPHVFA